MCCSKACLRYFRSGLQFKSARVNEGVRSSKVAIICPGYVERIKPISTDLLLQLLTLPRSKYAIATLDNIGHETDRACPIVKFQEKPTGITKDGVVFAAAPVFASVR